MEKKVINTTYPPVSVEIHTHQGMHQGEEREDEEMREGLPG